ncbi:hypothetical protein BJ944DRAFT_230937 [Cunninghamella echinulata]|nr:hypothetical protein BJ944DRAFT_230937 [Cunninghamella echinulata]
MYNTGYHQQYTSQQQQQHQHHMISNSNNNNTTIITQEDGLDESDTDSKPEKRSGRRKIKIEYIEDKSRRHITFSKRKAGIMKKAYELSTLTGTQILLLVVSETGLVYTFTTAKLQPLVTKPEGKNLIQSCLNAPDSNSNNNDHDNEDDSNNSPKNNNIIPQQQQQQHPTPMTSPKSYQTNNHTSIQHNIYSLDETKVSLSPSNSYQPRQQNVSSYPQNYQSLNQYGPPPTPYPNTYNANQSSYPY